MKRKFINHLKPSVMGEGKREDMVPLGPHKMRAADDVMWASAKAAKRNKARVRQAYYDACGIKPESRK